MTLSCKFYLVQRLLVKSQIFLSKEIGEKTEEKKILYRVSGGSTDLFTTIAKSLAIFNNQQGHNTKDCRLRIRGRVDQACEKTITGSANKS